MPAPSRYHKETRGKTKFFLFFFKLIMNLEKSKNLKPPDQFFSGRNCHFKKCRQAPATLGLSVCSITQMTNVEDFTFGRYWNTALFIIFESSYCINANTKYSFEMLSFRHNNIHLPPIYLTFVESSLILFRVHIHNNHSQSVLK